jgi:hypothetical protein
MNDRARGSFGPQSIQWYNRMKNQAHGCVRRAAEAVYEVAPTPQPHWGARRGIKLAAPLALALFAGCSNYSVPPATPAPTDIQAVAATLSAIDVPIKDYYTYGTALAVKNCVSWFSTQIAGASQNSALASELGLIGAAVGAAGGPIGASAAAAAGFGSATIGNIQTNSAVGIDPVVTYGLVRKVQQAWLAAATTPTTNAEAYLLVEDFAEKCQLPDIKKAVADAVASAPVKAVPTASAFSVSIQPSRMVLPPVIAIGAQP